MQRRCCWPPEPPGVAPEAILDLVPERGLAQRALDALVEIALSPIERGPKATLSRIERGNGLGFWKTMPMRRRTSTASTPGA